MNFIIMWLITWFWKPFCHRKVHIPSFFPLLGGASGVESSCSLWNVGLRDGKLWQDLEHPCAELGLEVITQQCAGKWDVASSWVGGAYPGLLRPNLRQVLQK